MHAGLVYLPSLAGINQQIKILPDASAEETFVGSPLGVALVNEFL